MTAIPTGFEPHFRKGPVTNPWEPLYSRRTQGSIDFFFEVRVAHCNSRSTLHGGVLATLCDNAMGLSLVALLDHSSINVVTINLTLDYIRAANLGDAVFILPRVLRAGGSIGFCDALASCGDQPIARASATFSVRSIDTRESRP
jgi:uncharacterized protein (TIGR00369 family)